MNKIFLYNNNIKLDLDDSITCEYTNDDVIKKLNIKILKNTKLEIKITEDIKLDMNLELDKNVTCNLLEIKTADKLKIQTKYVLREHSILNITKLHDVKKIFERNIINLKEKNGMINLVLKTISEYEEKYDFSINHQAPKTISEITNNGVNIETGTLEFNITTNVSKGNKDCIINQNNRIINLTNNPCTIRPVLLVDEVDVIANHSALIGNFKDEEYFYLERLGINKNDASKLLLEGFIKGKCNYPKEIINMFEKYWR